MQKKYTSTIARTTLISLDKLAETETFEDRTRGALGPYWTLVNLCKMDLDDPVVRQFIDDAIPKHEGHKADLMELLKHSEEDRDELENNRKIKVHYVTEFGGSHSVMELDKLVSFSKRHKILSLEYV